MKTVTKDSRVNCPKPPRQGATIAQDIALAIHPGFDGTAPQKLPGWPAPSRDFSASMQLRRPHCLLWTQSFRTPSAAHEEAIRSLAPALFGWRFLLEAPEPRVHLEAEEEETSPSLERAELLAVVRGLEALDQPSSVSLYTSSRFVLAGLRHGIVEWRTTNWHWEWFGRWAPVAHQDLWRRVETALRFHEMEPKWWSRPEQGNGSRRVIRFNHPSPLNAPHVEEWGLETISQGERSRRNAMAVAAADRESMFPRFDGFDF
jgi:ribonuclease HI